jgi:hypothetical protein
MKQSMTKITKYKAELSIFLLACVVLLVLVRLYGTRYYIAWPDETLFTDIAQSFAMGVRSPRPHIQATVWVWIKKPTLCLPFTHCS